MLEACENAVGHIVADVFTHLEGITDSCAVEAFASLFLKTIIVLRSSKSGGLFANFTVRIHKKDNETF